MRSTLLLTGLLSAAACAPDDASPIPAGEDGVVTPTDDTAGVVPEVRGPAPTAEAAPPTLRRLTTTQYRHAIRDLFGADVVLPSSLEPDERIEGLMAVGSARTTISSYGAERYAQAAYSVARQVLARPDLAGRWIDCTPTDVAGDACVSSVIARLGRVAWRRPLTPDEVAATAALVTTASATLGDVQAGWSYGIAALLTSPHFLYRVELGDGSGSYSGYELASRLAFFLWDTLPDAALLDAVESGAFDTEAGLAEQVDRMLVDERARDGVRKLFVEMLHLDELDGLTKDPAVFTYLRDALGASAREETLLGIEALVFDDDGSYLDLFTTHRTFIDRDLAALYDVPAPARDGFGEVWLDPADGRRGLLGQASFLALQAHPVSTSVTRRGVFIREVLFCQDIPDPPANANTAIPEVSEDARTMRERIAVHLQDPVCASCHQATDPIGLGFETFDGLGRARTTENGVTIDASGDLDGAPFADAAELAELVAANPATADCLVQTMLQYATGRLADDLSRSSLQWHREGFALAGHRVRWLMADIATSPAFRAVGEVR